MHHEIPRGPGPPAVLTVKKILAGRGAVDYYLNQTRRGLADYYLADERADERGGAAVGARLVVVGQGRRGAGAVR